MKILTVNPKVMMGFIGCLLFAATAAVSHPTSGSFKTRASQQSPRSGDLYDEIARMDTALFDALNAHDLARLKTFFSKDLEFYQDNDGLKTYQQSMKDLQAMFATAHDIRRELVKGSLEVYPIKDYGAIEIGSHTFIHTENGREVSGTFKFVHVWQQKKGSWKLTRVISYGHG
jgi:ketosteroid isomerase-like protein